MNCLEFRRAALAHPQHPGHAALAHETECAACTRFYRALRQQEEDLYQAVCVPVPLGLCERVLRQHTRPDASAGWRAEWLPRLAMSALAASFALVIALGVVWTQHRGMMPETLAAGLATHVAAEPQALAGNAKVPMATLVAAIRRTGGELAATPGPATFASVCPLPGGGRGEHIVFEGPHGKITLILMPDKRLDRPLRLDKDGLTVSLIPAGRGSLALILSSPARVGEAEAWAQTNLRWQRSRT